jgi:Lysophospholipase L1 and related esterases
VSNPKNRFVARTIDALKRSSGMAGSESVRYVALGDSVTAGWLEHGVLDADAAYPALFRRKLSSLYPFAVVNVLNMGLGGENASGALARFDRDVLRHDPHLVTICLGLNDARGGTEALDAFKANLVRLVERVQGETRADLLLVTPNTRGDALQEDGTVTEFVRAIRAVAREREVGLADVHAVYQGAIRMGAAPADLMSNRVSHPTREGHQIFANALIEFFQP